MNDDLRRPADGRGARWFDDGPTGAPGHLLRASLSRTSGTAQRPAWLARTLGTPTAEHPPARPDPRFVLAVAALALASVVAAVLVGGALVDDRGLVVAPTPGLTTTIVPTPLGSAGPSASAAPLPSPSRHLVVEYLYVDPTNGFSAVYRGDTGFRGPYGMWGSSPAPPEGVVSFWYGHCVDNLCQGYAIVSVGPLGSGTAVGHAPGTEDGWLRVSGASLDEVRASWTAVVGVSTFDDIVISGEPGLYASGGGLAASLAIHEARLYAIVAGQVPFVAEPTSRSLMDGFLADFQFTALASRPTGSAAEFVVPGTQAGAFRAIVPALGAPQLGESSIDVAVRGRLSDLLDPIAPVWVTVTVEREALFQARNALVLDRGAIRVQDLQIGNDPAMLVLPTDRHNEAPIAFVQHGPLTYRLVVGRESPLALPSSDPDYATDEQILREFLGGFVALDVAAD